MSVRPSPRVSQPRPSSMIFVGKGSVFANSTSSPELTQAQTPQLSSSLSSATNGTPPGLPSLPEPPSPGSSNGSFGSGLPSPPATNSTGSGSTGDPASIAVRKRPSTSPGYSNNNNTSTISANVSSGSSTSSGSHYAMRSSSAAGSRSSSRLASHDFADEDNREHAHDLDEDNTARLNHTNNSSSENVLALQRVKSLTQRNRMVLDKLSSISRLSSPSPARASPVPSSTSTRHSRLQPHEPTHSGSETERESTHSHSLSHHTPSPHHQPSASTSMLPSHTLPDPYTPSPAYRTRKISAPESPQSARLRGIGMSAVSGTSTSSSSNYAGSVASNAASGSNASYSPGGRRRKRASMGATVHLADFEEEEGGGSRYATVMRAGTDNIAQNPLTGASLRRNAIDTKKKDSPAAPTSSARKRNALPREFRGDLEDTPPVEPVTPYRQLGSGFARSATMREVRRSGGGDDFRPPGSSRLDDTSHFTLNSNNNPNPNPMGRRQSLRGGSAESALLLLNGSGRSLIGEGLRAAGLGFSVGTGNPGKRKDDGGPRTADIFASRERRVGWSSNDVDDERERRTIDLGSATRDAERIGHGAPPRAATSMADYRYRERDDADDRDLRGRERAGASVLKRNSTVTMTKQDRELALSQRERSIGRRERELGLDRASSSLSRYNTITATASPYAAAPSARLPHERHSTTPSQHERFASRRYSAQTPSSATFATNEGGTGSGQFVSQAQSQTEHTRLMIESLGMFEAQLAKIQLPVGGAHGADVAGASYTELTRNAQSIAFAAERLNGLLRSGTSRALEAQIDAEVAGEDNSAEIGEVWRRVGGDYREGLRAADELVRGVTGFFLGVGRMMRELGGGDTHSRSGSVSLGDEESASGSERRSVESRRSWEPGTRDRERDREEALQRLAGGRAPSALGGARSSPAFREAHALRESALRESPFREPSGSKDSLALQPFRDRADGHLETPLRGSALANGSGSMRRLLTPREQREHNQHGEEQEEQIREHRQVKSDTFKSRTLVALDSQATLLPRTHEPSPTPAPRARDAPPQERAHVAPPPIPKPLPALPSEKLVQRSVTMTALDKPRTERRKVTLPSISTARAVFPAITTPSNTTTALTPHTVSNSPERTTFPISRTESGSSARSQVTFSRPAVSALSGLQQQDSDRQRTSSSTSATADPNPSPTATVTPISTMTPQSGSETEREPMWRRRNTVGIRAGVVPRASLDGTREPVTRASMANAHAADRSAVLAPGPGRKERRGSIADLWPRS